jgi:hypothetical protein
MLHTNTVVVSRFGPLTEAGLGMTVGDEEQVASLGSARAWSLIKSFLHQIPSKVVKISNSSHAVACRLYVEADAASFACLPISRNIGAPR